MLELYNKVMKNPYYHSKFRKSIKSNNDINTFFKKELIIKMIENLSHTFNLDDTEI